MDGGGGGVTPQDRVVSDSEVQSEACSLVSNSFRFQSDFHVFVSASLNAGANHTQGGEFLLSAESRNCQCRLPTPHFFSPPLSRESSLGLRDHKADLLQVFTAPEWPPLPLSRVIRRELLVRDVF